MKPSFVRRLSPQAFVGHLVLSGSRSEGGPPTMGFGDDWREELLGRTIIPKLISAQSEEWIEQLVS
jgi:hypothetical protein